MPDVLTSASPFLNRFDVILYDAMASPILRPIEHRAVDQILEEHKSVPLVCKDQGVWYLVSPTSIAFLRCTMFLAIFPCIKEAENWGRGNLGHYFDGVDKELKANDKLGHFCTHRRKLPTVCFDEFHNRIT